MVTFTAIIERFDQQGEKTGWSYIKIPSVIAEQIKPGYRKSFRVKGTLDHYHFSAISVVPMGGGDFILAVNGTIRKAIAKGKGATVNVKIEADNSPVTLSPELLECLADEPTALEFFNQLSPSHRKYYSNWIESAKTEATKAKRIAQAVNACARKQHYGEMIRWLKENKID